jgi:hypothetical protein
MHVRRADPADYESLQHRVLAAKASLEREGVYPSNARIAKAAGIRLIDTGAITEILTGGGLIEQPDDPDAAEIQARIAEVRATKEASPSARPTLSVATGRFHHPSRRVGSRQRVVA